ncbi:MAG TPA: transcription antitermination factor NusB, partial [Chitinophagaceae bacterium]
MISRRNIRVKVMQLLYALETMDGSGKSDPVKILRQQLDASRSLFVYLVYSLTELARYPEKDSALRAAKNLPSAADLNVNIKLAGNETLWKILENESFRSAM